MGRGVLAQILQTQARRGSNQVLGVGVNLAGRIDDGPAVLFEGLGVQAGTVAVGVGRTLTGQNFGGGAYVRAVHQGVAFGVHAVAGGVDFAATRVGEYEQLSTFYRLSTFSRGERSFYILFPGCVSSCVPGNHARHSTLSQRGQAHHAVHRHRPGKTQSARSNDTGAKARKRSRTGTGQNCIQIFAAHASVLQGRLRVGAHHLGVGAGIFTLVAGEDFEGRTGFGAVHTGERHRCGGG